MKTILVPTDLSKQSEYVVETAAGIAEKANAILTILHVINQPADPSFIASGEYIPEGYENRLFTLQLLKARNKQLKDLSTREYLKNITVKYELKVASFSNDITDIILEYKTDLIVMGTRPHSRGEVFLGSTVNKIMRHAKCPIMTLQQRPSSTEYKNIVFATSMSEDEGVFSRIVKTAQHLYGGTIHLVKINTKSRFLPEHIAKEQMKEYALFNQFTNFTISVFSDLTEEEGIIHFAEKINADIIAVATHGRSNFAHLVSGSISKEVVNHAKSPVLTFLVEH